MVDVTQYWILAKVVTKIYLALGSPLPTIYNMEQMRPQAAPNGNPGVMLTQINQYGQWFAEWFLEKDPVRGVLEYKDAYPLPWGGVAVMASGYKVPWGVSTMSIGQTISLQLHVDPSQSAGYPTTDSAYMWGWQTTTLTAVLPNMDVPAGTYYNVIRLDWTQYWCANATCTTYNGGAGTFYMAPGVGVIRRDMIDPPDGGIYVLGAISITDE